MEQVSSFAYFQHSFYVIDIIYVANKRYGDEKNVLKSLFTYKLYYNNCADVRKNIFCGDLQKSQEEKPFNL